MNKETPLYPTLERAFRDTPELFQVLLETNTPAAMSSMELVATNYDWIGPELVRTMSAARKAAEKKVGGE